MKPTKEKSRFNVIQITLILAGLAFLCTILYPVILSLLLSMDSSTNEWGWTNKKSFGEILSNYMGTMSFFSTLSLLAIPFISLYYIKIQKWAWYILVGILCKELMTGLLSSWTELKKYNEFKTQIYDDYQSFHFYDTNILLTFHFILFILLAGLIGGALFFCFHKKTLQVFEPENKWMIASISIGILISFINHWLLNSYL